MIVYHGSSHIIQKPVYNGSKRSNDYGYGFYTTESIELAKEWACSDGQNGFANKYTISSTGSLFLPDTEAIGRRTVSRKRPKLTCRRISLSTLITSMSLSGIGQMTLTSLSHKIL